MFSTPCYSYYRVCYIFSTSSYSYFRSEICLAGCPPCLGTSTTRFGNYDFKILSPPLYKGIGVSTQVNVASFRKREDWSLVIFHRPATVGAYCIRPTSKVQCYRAYFIRTYAVRPYRPSPPQCCRSCLGTINKTCVDTYATKGGGVGCYSTTLFRAHS